MCDAIIEVRTSRLQRPRQGLVCWKFKNCSRPGIEHVGPLVLCKVHARLAREGLISQEGVLAPAADRANVRLYPHKFPKGLYDWASKC